MSGGVSAAQEGNGQGEEGQFGLDDMYKKLGEVGVKDAPFMSCIGTGRK